MIGRKHARVCARCHAPTQARYRTLPSRGEDGDGQLLGGFLQRIGIIRGGSGHLSSLKLSLGKVHPGVSGTGVLKHEG